MKKLLLSLAAAGTALVAAPAAAHEIGYRHTHVNQPRVGISVTLGTNPYNYGYRNYEDYGYSTYDNYGQYRRGYRGPIFLDRYSGRYLCIRPNGTYGLLTDRYGMPVTRYNMRSTYYGTPRQPLRCK